MRREPAILQPQPEPEPMLEVKFSVVIPTYNRAKMLAQALESVLSQSYAPLEILVVDDGSTDDTSDVAERFGKHVRYIRQDNAGVSVARNRGIKESRGDIIAFLDSDDAWEPEKLEIHAAVYQRWPEVGWAVSDIIIVDDDRQPYPGVQGFSRAFPLFPDRRLEPRDFFSTALALDQLEVCGGCHEVFHGDAFVLLLQGNFVQPSALTVRRELLERVGGFDDSFRVAGDTELAPRLAADSEGAIIMTSLARWLIGTHESIVKPQNLITLMENAIVSLERAVTPRILNVEERQAYQLGLESLWLRLAYEHLSNLDRTDARRSLRSAFAAGVPKSRRAIGLWTASMLPLSFLRFLHGIKRLMQKK